MSDNDDDSKPNSSQSSKHSLKSATGKLKAEALRRLQLKDAEYDDENGPENGSSRESTDETLKSTGENEQDEGNKDKTAKGDVDEGGQEGSGVFDEPNTNKTGKIDTNDNDKPEIIVSKTDTEVASGENSNGDISVEKDEQSDKKEEVSVSRDREDESKTPVNERGESKFAETAENEGTKKEVVEGTSDKARVDDGNDPKGSGSGGDNTTSGETGNISSDNTGGEVAKDEIGAKGTSSDSAGRPSSGTLQPGTGSKISQPGSGKAPVGETSSGAADRPSSGTSRPGTGTRRSRPGSGKAPLEDASKSLTKDDGHIQDQGVSKDHDQETKSGGKTDEGSTEQTAGEGDNEGQKGSGGVDGAGDESTAGPSTDKEGATASAKMSGDSKTDPNVTKCSATETESKSHGSQSSFDDSNVDGKSGEKTLDKGEETSDEVSPPMSEPVPQNNVTSNTDVQDSSQEESKDKVPDRVKKDSDIGTDDKSIPKQDSDEKEKSAAAESSQDNGDKNDDVSAGNADGKAGGADAGGSAEKQASDSNLKNNKNEKGGSGDETGGGPSEDGKEKDGDEKGKDDENEKEKEGKKKKSKKSKKNEKGESIESSEGEKEEQQEQESKENQEEGVPTIQGEGDEEEDALPDDFYYDYDGVASKPYRTEGIPDQLITLHHSFGYECTRRSNLHVMDEDTVLFSAGNVVQLLNIKTQEQSYFRTTGGGGIGAIAVHPSRKYFAVAEKGVKPDINIFEYPSLKLYRVLRDGTEVAYANLDFSPDGTQLASVGSSPDYMMTIWDWKKEKISLRTKAFAQDIYQVAFSPDNEGHITTGGSGHIRFWTMANTFTGLKLQGLIGKFGAKEISDIEGFVELPDGKVLSGSDWGNMLLWEGGLIKVEICKKGKKTCHQGMIQQFFMDEGELMSIGVDGYVKVWDFESIDTADTDEEGSLFEVDPMYELKVGTDVKLMSMQKAVNSEAPIWYAQDAAGGIWKLDLSFTHTSHAPEHLFSYHAGIITGMDTSPVAHFVATTGVDHTVRVYDYLSKKQICHKKYNSGGSNLLWVPKMVDAKGTSILAGFADGVVRLLTLNKVDLSQVRSKKSKSNYELTLTQAFKPHTKPVTVITIDYDGELLATGSDDCTVFFFTIGDTYKPIGFIETASPVVSIVWSNKGKKGKGVLVSCKDGTVLEVEAPQHGEHDTSKTYHLPLQNLKITEFFFKSVKDKLRKAEKDAIKAKEKAEKQKKKEAERARRRERGIEEEEDENEEEENEKEEEEEKRDHGPSQIIHGFYYGKTTDRFYLSMDGWDAGYLYECAFDDKPPPPPGTEDRSGEPKRCIPVDNSNDVPIRSVYFTNSKKFIIFGMDNGAVRIHPLEQDTELEHLSSYWSFSIHDNHNGTITKIKTSFDDKYVFTTGHDGNFFVHKFMDKALKGIKVPHKVSLPSPKKLIGEDGQEIQKKVDDIDDPNFYSIELEKQKAEHDRMMKLAEEKKQNIRRKITNLRKAFKQLMNRNQELPSHVQLKTEEFVVDPKIKEELKAKTQEKMELVRKELEWESEKQSIGLKKLQKRFKDEVECERIVLRAFLTEHLVSSFRASKPDYLHLLLQEAEGTTGKGQEGQDGGTNKKSAVRQMRRQSTAEKMLPQQQQQLQQQAAQGQSQLGGKVAKALEKAEARRIKRMNRQAQWDELNRNKPDENYEDPKDKAAIKEAKENMGDYKLKTAKDYVVPESQRVNAEKKRLQLLKLLDQIHQYKFEFNQNFLALRNKKIAIIKEAKENIIKIEEMQKKIELHARRPIPKVPEMRPDEQPERRLEYTRERLLEFKKELLTKQDGHGEESGGGFGGFGGFGGGGEAGKQGGQSKPGTQARDRSVSSVSVHSGGRPKSSLSGPTDKGTPEPLLEEVPEEPSPLELQIQQEEQIKLQYEQDVLIDNIQNMMKKFDADLRTLRHDKQHLDVALKCADLRQVTLFEEYMLLKEFEKRENVYATKVNTKLTEKEEMQDKVEDCQMKLEAKKQDIEKLLDREKTLYTTFSTAMGENNKFENFLTKVFKKKIKRAKKKAQTEKGSDEESDEEDSDEDLSSSDEEDSDAEELDDTVCPPGCDQALFDQVCQLRENRLDLEEELADEKKASETLKKECDALVKKAKVIDSALNTAEADLEAFQREKQQKLNELDVVVVLRLSQIQYMINNTIPQDLSPCLVFCGSGLNQLQHRIKELEKEKHEQKRLYREHRHKHVQLIRDKKVMESKIAELDEKVENMMMLKFGRLVDLEKLETVSVNRTVEELKEKLRQQEVKAAKDVAKWDTKIDSYKSKITQLTRENTQRLDTFTVLLEEKKELEQMLDSRQKSLGTEFTGARKADVRERQRLIQLVQLQAQEIDALKDEITLLSRKGGHILPPAQPPLPPGQTPIPNA